MWSYVSISKPLRGVFIGKPLRGGGGSTRGSVVVEFAMIGFIFFALLLGAVDLGRYQITVQSLHDVTAEAARVALLHAGQATASNGQNGTSATTLMTGAALKAAVTASNPTPFLAPASLNVTSALTSPNGVATITVTATYPFTFLAPLLPGGASTLTDSVSLSY
jgi:Flp pilus assembly protein TadG